jgi:hypothetical protein
LVFLRRHFGKRLGSQKVFLLLEDPLQMVLLQTAHLRLVQV